MNRSIKRFLLITITLAILVIYGFISFVSYWVSKEELDELYDSNLLQVAGAIAAQHLAIQDATHLYVNNQVGMGTKIEGEEEFYVRVLAQDGTALYVSHPQVKVPFSSAIGFSTQKYLGKKWRFYTINARKETIQVAQSLNLRAITIKETALSLMASQLLFIPILVMLIFIAINKALSPILGLSGEIQQRKSHDLAPISVDKIPIEIKPLVHSLNSFMSRVSDMVEILKRFTSDAAHELRTPITALRLQLAVIEQAESKAERAAGISSLKGGIDRSEQLVSQLLEFARIEPNHLAREILPITLLSLIKECVEALFPLAHAKSIDLGLNTTAELITFGVRQEVKVLINNILDNAIRYTPNHGKVDISLLLEGTNIVLEVTDSGPGISSVDLDHVFERFYRGENKDAIGSGLGLSIVKEIATQHGAIVELINLNPGLRFRVYFVR